MQSLKIETTGHGHVGMAHNVLMILELVVGMPVMCTKKNLDKSAMLLATNC
jgi:hypothetical protein